jgi:hypothetical protein
MKALRDPELQFSLLEHLGKFGDDRTCDEVVRINALREWLPFEDFRDRLNKLGQDIADKQSAREQIDIPIEKWLNQLKLWLSEPLPSDVIQALPGGDIELTEIVLHNPASNSQINQLNDDLHRTLPILDRKIKEALPLLEKPVLSDRTLRNLGVGSSGLGLALAVSGSIASLATLGKNKPLALGLDFVGVGLLYGTIIQNERFGLARFSPLFRSPGRRFDQAGAILADVHEELTKLHANVKNRHQVAWINFGTHIALGGNEWASRRKTHEEEIAALSAAHRKVQSAAAKYHGTLAVLLAQEAQHVTGFDKSVLSGLAKAEWLRAKSANLNHSPGQGRSLKDAYLLRADAIENRHDTNGLRFGNIAPPARTINVADLDKTADLIAEAAPVRAVLPLLQREWSAEVDQVPQQAQPVPKHKILEAFLVVAAHQGIEVGSKLAVGTPARQRLDELRSSEPKYTDSRRLGIRL